MLYNTIVVKHATLCVHRGVHGSRLLEMRFTPPHRDAQDKGSIFGGDKFSHYLSYNLRIRNSCVLSEQ